MARLYLNAKSKHKIGYTPDWIRLSLPNNEELTLDIRGEIDYDRDTLSCRVKGDLDPWVHIDSDGEEVDLYELPEEEVEERFSNDVICDAFKKSTEIVIGIYPVDDSRDNLKLAADDELTDCSGKVEIYSFDENGNDKTFMHYFKFEPELMD